MTVLVQLRQFCLMKLILVYVLIYFLFNFHQILLWQLWATTHISKHKEETQKCIINIIL